MKVTNEYIPNMKIFQPELNKIYDDQTEKVSETNQGGFGEFLKAELDKVNEKQIQSDNTLEGYINGERSLHEVILESEEAKLSLELAIQVRNKLVAAYDEFNKMQL